MQRLLEDDTLKISSVQLWKKVIPKVFSQIELEVPSNRRLCAAVGELDMSDKGI